MALLTSEICRLILGFLEDENLPKTYETFLAESKYLEECRVYMKRGIKFPKIVHGKNLVQHLNSNYEKTFNSVETETEFLEHESYKPPKQDMQTQTGNENIIEPLQLNTSIVPFSQETERPSFNKRKSCNFKRKSNILTPTKSFRTEPELFPINTEHLTDAFQNFDEALLDIDSFIQSLCQNQFPEKLAQSINQLNAKKSSPSDDGQIVFDNPPLQEIEPVRENQTLNDSIQIIDQNEVDVNKKEQVSPMDQSEINSIKFWIANEDISILADHYSEPVVETLFEVFNSSRENEEGDTETIPMETESLKPEQKQPESSLLKEKTHKETINETILLNETVTEKTLETSEQITLTCSVAENRKSMIVIGKSSDEVEKITNEWREKESNEKEVPSQECLANAAVIQDLKTEAKENTTSTPNKIVPKQGENSMKRPRTIREIYDKEKSKTDDSKETEPITNDTEFKKKFKKPTVKRPNRTYFYDFYQDIKNNIEENVDNNDDDMPDIFRYARKVQDNVKNKLMCQNRKNL